ncbi:alpha-ketoglutarate-dependent 2,4-dichlorophenoxyacetate dioxygenase [Capronia coronata CBS 617.96]|uniref:Alpha-ketoglutarate-dependent 2,4-dichlorophenoxyacetate dioxygenase n=1 Tax=Capronia coronata CBS 617.96 TaxID=1182541 RepID=W9Y179_9EURO|nr:alpha-ketoglutarate-dependent 2,4-dichlorophenoxyacetate dioxygenase [Capronia coronata CBS 617.96]EXJ83360.1 alpha-ketoglutarate-dependent 2,4-dichlorophenoxyacetate dioxygenase [Capronia coronata CBS 617.96]
MPHATEPVFQHIQVKQLAPTFGAEVTGIDFSKPVEPEVFKEIHDAITEYGVLVFRRAALDDARHVAFSRLFGELDDVKPYLGLGRQNRFPFDELFDVSNLEDDGSLVQVGSKRDHVSKGNSLFHVDSAFNPRRAGYSLLRAHELPPPGYGGNTDFADTRTAYDELPPDLKAKLSEMDYVGANSLWHSRKKACPDSEFLRDMDPEAYPFGRHRILQLHEPSGRTNLYIANHLHHLEYLDGTRVAEPEGTELIETLLNHASQPKYLLSVDWREPGDLICWDNTAVMHRAGEFKGMGKYKRDMRRTTVHDGSSSAWGLNDHTLERMGLP